MVRMQARTTSVKPFGATGFESPGRLLAESVVSCQLLSHLFLRFRFVECRWNYIVQTTGSRVRVPSAPRQWGCSSAAEHARFTDSCRRTGFRFVERILI